MCESKLRNFLKISIIILSIINDINAFGRFLNFDGMVTFHENSYCKNSMYNKKFAIIVHGWKESCNEPWAIKLSDNLKIYRGGCIICMDYNLIARIPHYFMLAAHSRQISDVLTRKLQQLENMGFDPNQGFMFGFSLGGRIVLEAGHMFGKRKIAEIDKMFIYPIKFFDPKESAKNVQCIHTSRDKGTIERNCHQDWNMGYCGYYQMAANNRQQQQQYSLSGSHSLCTEFYNNAFIYDFYAELNPQQCKQIQIQYKYWPNNFKMGYMENRKHIIYGEFYASTTKYYPYTINSQNNNSINYYPTNNEITSLGSFSESGNHYKNNNYKIIVIVNDQSKYYRKKKSLY